MRASTTVALAAAVIAAAAGVAIALSRGDTGSGEKASAGPGPIAPSGAVDQVTECVPLDHATDTASITVYTFTVPRDASRLVLDRVDAVQPRNARIVGALLVRHRLTGVGYWPTYPPTEAAQIPGVDWQHRQHLDGATVSTTPADSAYDVVVGVRMSSRSRPTGTFDSVAISYHEGTRRYRFTTPIAGLIVTAPERCPG